MDKPISIIVEETKQSLADVINNCKLHPVVLEMIIKDVYLDICQFNIANINKEKEQYLKESTNNKK